MADVSGVLFSAPAQGAILYVTTVAQPQPGRGILISCSVNAVASVTFGDGTTIAALPLAAGTIYMFNWAVVTWTLTSGTAVAWLLK